MDILTIILILIGLIFSYFIGTKIGSLQRDLYWKKELPNHRKEAVSKSRSVLCGQFSEQLAPFLPGFEYSPTECRFIGKPIDLIIFNGMDKKEIQEVVFVEVKSGDSKLTSTEKNLKNAIQAGNVRWEEYRIDKDLTKNKNK